jgi:hypothetical protein
MKRAQKITSIVFMVAILNCICVASASVVVSPSSAQVKPGGQLQFTTTGAVDDIVIWSLQRPLYGAGYGAKSSGSSSCCDLSF